MKKFTYKDFMQLLQDNPDGDIKQVFTQQFNDDNVTSKAVLGIDIYRYSKYDELPRNLLPFVAQILLDSVIELCIKNEEYLFQKETKDSLKKLFINTGDGGYFIFDNPLQAIVFAINLEVAVRLFNSSILAPRLRNLVGPATLRYAMTYDKVYKYEDNYYGAGIITNARILSKDKLDRFLVDENVYEWFMQNTNGIDNLQMIALDEDIFNLKEFKEYKKISNSQIFYYEDTKVRNLSNLVGFKSIDVQKIGELKIKDDSISIYNLHIQISNYITIELDTGDMQHKITVSLGNLNVSGISE